MALSKMLRIGDELVFDFGSEEFREWFLSLPPEKAREIRVVIVDRGGAQVFLKIWADYSIKIHQFRQYTMGKTERIEIGPVKIT